MTNGFARILRQQIVVAKFFFNHYNPIQVDIWEKKQRHFNIKLVQSG